MTLSYLEEASFEDWMSMFDTNITTEAEEHVTSNGFVYHKLVIAEEDYTEYKYFLEIRPKQTLQISFWSKRPLEDNLKLIPEIEKIVNSITLK